MMFEWISAAIVFYPLFVCFLIVLFPWRENWLSRLLVVFAIINASLTGIFVVLFFLSGFKPLEVLIARLLHAGSYHFNLMLLIDKYSVSFQALIGILTNIVVLFSRRYMHREHGYRRFFASLFLFNSGISLVALAATLDVLFAGWEIVGVSSFLLIGFYRIRLQPGRNSLRAYAVYRFCDVGLFTGAWLFHNLGSEYFFLQYADRALDPEFVQLNFWFFVAIGILTIIAAMGKSAQYPFSFWVPRVMEGPTPSSAIFYGALSIHAGVYLLIRMWPLWRAVEFMPFLVGFVGLVTAIASNISSKTQSNIKGQIGYASVAQVGIMFVELALGYRDVAMLHFLGNAVLRCYQLLASPSVMVLFLREQAQGVVPNLGFTYQLSRFLNEKWQRRLFALSISECYSEWIVSSIWSGLKKFAKLVNKFFSAYFFIVLILALLMLESFGRAYFSEKFIHTVCAVVFGFSAVSFTLSALGEGVYPLRVLWLTGISSVFKGVSFVYLNPQDAIYSLPYFVGILVGFIIANLGLKFIPIEVRKVEYAGAALLYPRSTNAFFIGILWMTGFTLSPTFFGDDILLQLGAEKFAYETFFMAGIFVLSAVTLFRSYVKLAFAR